MKLPQIGESWKHFKGDVYWIVEHSFGAEGELQLRVLYCKRKDGNGPVYSREIMNFIGPVDDRAEARFTRYTKDAE